MVKETKKNKRSGFFLIPTIEEVQQYILKKKPGWGKAFCDWYGEKFWNSYEKSGWKLSAGKGGPVKNWQACFNSNWQTLKYSEDIAILDRFRPKPKPVDPDTLDWMTDVLEEYRKDPETVSKERLTSCYDWIKEQGFTKMLTSKQMEQAIQDSKIDLLKGKETAVRFFFDYMVKNLISFNYFFNEVCE